MLGESPGLVQGAQRRELLLDAVLHGFHGGRADLHSSWGLGPACSRVMDCRGHARALVALSMETHLFFMQVPRPLAEEWRLERSLGRSGTSRCGADLRNGTQSGIDVCIGDGAPRLDEAKNLRIGGSDRCTGSEASADLELRASLLHVLDPLLGQLPA